MPFFAINLTIYKSFPRFKGFILLTEHDSSRKGTSHYNLCLFMLRLGKTISLDLLTNPTFPYLGIRFAKNHGKQREHQLFPFRHYCKG